MGYLAPPDDPKAPAFVVGAWMGNSDNSAPPGGVVSLETAASLWQSFLTAATKGQPIADFVPPPAWCRRRWTPSRGCCRGRSRRKTVKEWFIDGTAPTQVDNTKVGSRSTRDRQAVAARLPGPRGDPGLPGPQQRRSRLPALEAVHRRLDRARREGARASPAGPRRRGRATSTRPGCGPRTARLGRPVPAHQDVRARQPVAGAVAVVRPARPVQPVPEPGSLRFDPAVPPSPPPRPRLTSTATANGRRQGHPTPTP